MIILFCIWLFRPPRRDCQAFVVAHVGEVLCLVDLDQTQSAHEEKEQLKLQEQEHEQKEKEKYSKDKKEEIEEKK